MSLHAMLKRIKGNHQDTSRSRSTMSKATADPETMSVEPIPDEDAALERTPALGFKPSGVARMEAISAQLTTPLRVIMLSSIFLMSFAYGLDGSVRWSFQAYATSEMQGHAHLAAVNVVRSAIATVAQVSSRLNESFDNLTAVSAYHGQSSRHIRTYRGPALRHLLLHRRDRH